MGCKANASTWCRKKHHITSKWTEASLYCPSCQNVSFHSLSLSCQSVSICPKSCPKSLSLSLLFLSLSRRICIINHITCIHFHSHPIRKRQLSIFIKFIYIKNYNLIIFFLNRSRSENTFRIESVYYILFFIDINLYY